MHILGLLCLPLLSVSCLAYSSALKMGRYVLPKRRLTLNGLHGVISQKIILFITTAVKTSNPTLFISLLLNDVAPFAEII
jgi:hypothetical protein